MKQIYDRGHQERTFQTGDYMYVHLQPYGQHSLAKRVNMKLAAKFCGPFRVLDWIGEVAYKLALSLGSKVHPVFHVSLLKQKFGPATLASIVLLEYAAILQTSSHKQSLVSVVPVLTKKLLFIGGDLIMQMLLGRRSWSFMGVSRFCP